jgi:peptidoglycan/xylan/chitin deacetylase (PgdA/CDA1 family)
MCELCGTRLSRRAVGRLSLGVGMAMAGVRRGDAVTRDAAIEPRMRLAAAPPGQRTVALTFDACPGRFDARVADVLIAERIPATIFLTALWIRWNPDGLTRLLAHPDLFAFENHGELHIPPVLGAGRIFGIRVAGDLATVRREVLNGARAVQEATGIAPRWYRAAAGFYSPSVIPVIQAMGFAIGGYSYSADAGASLPAAPTAARLERAANGDMVVAHINQPLRASGAGVAEGLLKLKRDGAHFVRLDQVAATTPL